MIFIMKKLLSAFIVFAMVLSLAISPSYAKTKRKKKTPVKIGMVTKVKTKVTRGTKKNAKIKISWQKYKKASGYEISLQKKVTVKKKIKNTKTKKTKVKKIKKTTYQKLVTTKKTSFTITKPYKKTYYFGIRVIKGKKKGKRKIVKVKVASYKKTKEDKKKKKKEDDLFPKQIDLKVDEEKTIRGKFNKDASFDAKQNGIIGITKVEKNSVTIRGISSGTTDLVVQVDYEKDVTCKVHVSEAYSYNLKPLLAPFNQYYFLETNDPDPYDLQFIDQSTIYQGTNKKQAVICAKDHKFVDVKYTDDTLHRVNGGYILETKDVGSDGGELIMKRRVDGDDAYSKPYTYKDYANDHTESTNGSFVSTTESNIGVNDYVTTDIKVTLPTVYSVNDYLINTYTSPQANFFDNMDRVEKALGDYAVYPLDCFNTQGKAGYASLCASPYKENPLMIHYDRVYPSYTQSSQYLLMAKAYPFTLDSAGFPAKLRAIAKKLNPNVQIDYGYNHELFTATLDGVTKTYGGQGSGSYSPLFDTRIDSWFTFDHSASDFASQMSLDTMQSKLLDYHAIADQDVKPYEDTVSQETVNKVVGKNGAWIQVGIEGTSSSGLAYTNDGQYALSDCFVDGRYVNSNELFEKGTSFSQHPTASIFIAHGHYTAYGYEHDDEPMLFTYDKNKDCWIDQDHSRSYTYRNQDIPSDFILTHDQVNAMNVDANKDTWPEHGYIYDGSAAPGTYF